jgi:hypothetical protein
MPSAVAQALERLRYRDDIAESERLRIVRATRILMAAEADGALQQAMIDLALDSFVSCVFAALARSLAALLGCAALRELEALAAEATLEGGPVLSARRKLDPTEWVGIDLCAKEAVSQPWDVRDRLFLPERIVAQVEGEEVDEKTYFEMVVPQLLLIEKELSVEYCVLHRDRFVAKSCSRRLQSK